MAGNSQRIGVRRIIAVFGSVNSMKETVEYTNLFSDISELLTIDVGDYDVILINGNKNNAPSTLPYEVVSKLWKFVENGGLLYGEMVNCEDFPTSRLFGFKQDFSVTSRRLEKLRIAKDNPFCQEGQLLEWNGEFLTGFTFDTETLVELDIFPETHSSPKNGKYPGIVTKKLGKGRTIFSTFSLLGNEQSWTLRPNWLWNRLLDWLKSEFGLPIQNFAPTIQLKSKTVDQVISESANWFLQSGIMPETRWDSRSL